MSLDRVPGHTRLFIGGLFTLRRYEALKDANITHVLSALRLPLDPQLFAAYEHFVVEVDDDEDEDILQYFAASNAFIHRALQTGGGVLVHCAAGKSRSATLVIAYLLSLAPAEATPTSLVAELRTVRSIVEPNPGFMEQLELYHSLGCPSDIPSQPAYQRWLYRREVEASVACGRAPESIRFGDEAASQSVQPDGDLEYRCRKCRRNLATSAYLVPHLPKGSSSSDPDDTGPIVSLSAVAPRTTPPRCAHLFLEPLSWMRPELEQGKLDGRLECPNPKCRTNVGKYAWQGMRCSCGEWIVPGISLVASRVDELRSRTRAWAAPSSTSTSTSSMRPTGTKI